MFSKSCEYAIRAMIFVAQSSKNSQRVSVKEVAKATDAPEHYIAKIMQELSRKRLVQSIKGPNGGFFMSNQEMKTTLADILRAVEGDGLYLDCVLGLKKCSEKSPCPVHFEFKEIKAKIIHMMESNTIGNFNEKLLSGKFFLRNK